MRSETKPAANGSTSTGSAPRPSLVTCLPASTITIMRAGRRRDDLLAQHGAAFSLDRAQLRIELVGAVDGQIEPCQRVEGKHRQAGRFRGAAGGERRCDGRHLQARRDPFPERGDGEVRRRAGAKADQHPVLDLGDGGACRRSFACRDIVLVRWASCHVGCSIPLTAQNRLHGLCACPAEMRSSSRAFATIGHIIRERPDQFRRLVLAPCPFDAAHLAKFPTWPALATNHPFR